MKYIIDNNSIVGEISSATQANTIMNNIIKINDMLQIAYDSILKSGFRKGIMKAFMESPYVYLANDSHRLIEQPIQEKKYYGSSDLIIYFIQQDDIVANSIFIIYRALINEGYITITYTQMDIGRINTIVRKYTINNILNNI